MLLHFALAAFTLPAFASPAQQPDTSKLPSSTQTPQPTTIRVNVEVDAKSGSPISGLAQSDFTLLDNNAVRPLAAVRSVNRDQEPVEVILLFDAVNAPFHTVASERIEVEKFLRADGGKLPVPFTAAILTDKGTQILKGSSRDGNALAASIEANAPGLRELNHAEGFWGADQRFQISLKSVEDIIGYTAKQPGRKILLWISPGWPLLSGPGIQLYTREQERIFSTVVTFSTALRNANITLDSLNPLGPGESLVREEYYQSFLRGVRKPKDTNLADLSVQVLALQSGGFVLNSTDVGFNIRKCIADAESWYELSFQPLPAEHPNEYHHIEVRTNRPNLTVRTRDGYYAQP